MSLRRREPPPWAEQAFQHGISFVRAGAAGRPRTRRLNAGNGERCRAWARDHGQRKKSTAESWTHQGMNSGSPMEQSSAGGKLR